MIKYQRQIRLFNNFYKKLDQMDVIEQPKLGKSKSKGTEKIPIKKGKKMKKIGTS